MTTPVEPPHDYSLIEWILGAAWVVLVTVGGILARIYNGLRNKVTAVELATAALEKALATLDHDVRGVRMNQVASDRKTDDRHRDNQQEWAELREFIGDEMREMRRRVDRLLERTGGGIDQR